MNSSVRRIPKTVAGLITSVVVILTLALAGAGSAHAASQPTTMLQEPQETETAETEVSTPIPTWTPIPSATPTVTSTPTTTPTATATATLTPTSSPSALPLPTATPDLPQGQVTANLNFNQQPNYSNSPDIRLGLLVAGQILWVYARTEDCKWYQVEPTDGPNAGSRGWVSKEFVELNDGVQCEEIPLGEGQSPVAPIPDEPPPVASAVESPPVPPTEEPSPEPAAVAPEPTIIVEVPTPPVEEPVPADEQGSNNTLGLILAGLGVLVLGVLAWFGIRKGWFSFLSGAKTPDLSAAGPVGSQPPKPGMAYLEGRLATGEAVYFPLNQAATTIGRMEDNMVVLDARFAQVDSISRYHAKIERKGDQYILTDLQSENGVFVNQRRSAANLLVDGTTLRLGQVEFLFRTNTE